MARSWLEVLGAGVAQKTEEKRAKEEEAAKQQQMQQALTQLLVGAPKFEPQTTMGPKETPLQGDKITWNTQQRQGATPTFPNAMMDPGRAQAYAQLGAQTGQGGNIMSALLSRELEGATGKKWKPIPGAPGMFYNEANPAETITSEEAKRLALEAKKAGAARQSVTVMGDTMEEEYSKKTGGKFADMRNEISDQAAQGQAELRTIQNARGLLASADTGPGAVTMSQAKAIAERLGLDIDTTSANATLALNSVLAKSAIQDLSQFPGQISEGERKFVIEVNANPNQPAGVIEELLRIKEKLANAKRQKLGLVAQWEKKYGSLARPNENDMYFDAWYDANFGAPASVEGDIFSEADAVLEGN